MNRPCCPDRTCAPAVGPVDRRDEDAELARLAKALAHPIRVWIVRLLACQEECICGRLVEQLPVAQATVSQHLKVLKEAGLVRGEVDGPRVCYCLAPEVLDRLKQLVGQLESMAPHEQPRRPRGAGAQRSRRRPSHADV